MAKDDNNKEELKALKQIREYKLICESNIVSALWKHPDLYFMYDNLTLEMFSHNEWKVYFTIGKDIIVTEQKKVLDEMTVSLYLEKHPKLREKYIEYGAFTSIELAKGYIEVDNIDGYVSELNKWNTLMNLSKNNFPISKRLKEFTDMSVEDIYNEYEAVLNHVFINVEGEDKTYDIADGIDELIDKLDEGLAVGLEYYNSPILTEETGGSLLGNITLIGGISGVGKTALARNLLLPSIEATKEKIVIMLNEEGKEKWQRELLIWVANNIYKKDIQKYKLRNGKYSPEFKDFLKNKCGKWIKDHKKMFILKPFQRYSTDKAIKCIKKYAHMGVKYFILDTYKQDSNASNEQVWMNMQQNMVKIHDVIKSESLNVSITITFQLSKNSSKQRYYTQDNTGMAKNIIDVAATCIMVRGVFEDEFEGGKRELKVYKMGGKNGKSKIPVKLSPDKHYQILFIVKNREGASNEYQIVSEHDLSRNIYKEIGICVVPVDF